MRMDEAYRGAIVAALAWTLKIVVSINADGGGGKSELVETARGFGLASRPRIALGRPGKRREGRTGIRRRVGAIAKTVHAGGIAGAYGIIISIGEQVDLAPFRIFAQKALQTRMIVPGPA